MNEIAADNSIKLIEASLTLFDMGEGHDGLLKMFLTTVLKPLGGGT